MENQDTQEQQTTTQQTTAEPVKFNQEQQAFVDSLINSKYKEFKQRYADYDDLKNKVGEYEKVQEQKQQQDMEAKQQYDELKKQWGEKEGQYKNLLTERDTTIQSIRIENALSQEVSRQDAYADAVNLIKPMAVHKDDGTVIINGKDSNGMPTELSLEDGVKQFLKERAYLVKASTTGGGGTGTSTTANPGNQSSTQLNLSDELQQAINSGNRQKVQEIKKAIQDKHASLGILR